MRPPQGQGATARRQRLDQQLDAEIGRRLRARRHERMLTLQQLAEISGLSVQQVQRSESGAARVTVVVLLRLAEALRVPPLAFLPDFAQEQAGADHASIEEESEGSRASAHELAIGLAEYLWKLGPARGGAG